MRQIREEMNVDMTGRTFTGFADLSRDEIFEMKTKLDGIFTRNGLPTQSEADTIRGRAYWRISHDPFDGQALPGRGLSAGKAEARKTPTNQLPRTA